MVLGGDNWDLGVISHWNEFKFSISGFENIKKRLHEEAEGLNDQLDSLRIAVGNAQIHYIAGNHEDWLRQFGQKFFQMSKEDLSVPNLLSLKKRRIDWITNHDGGCGGYMKLGKIHFFHGDQFGSDNAPKQALVRTGKTCVFGHYHAYKVWPDFSMVDELDKHNAYQVPAMCKLAPGYLKGRPHEWQNGWFTASVRKSGNFSAHIQLVSPEGEFADQFGRIWK